MALQLLLDLLTGNMALVNVPAAITLTNYFLLQEDGFSILQEDGTSKIILQ